MKFNRILLAIFFASVFTMFYSLITQNEDLCMWAIAVGDTAGLWASARTWNNPFDLFK
jgi:hypothetical protein